MTDSVHSKLLQKMKSFDNWERIGLYFQKGSFKTTQENPQQLYINTFLSPPGIHLYSTIPPVQAHIVRLIPHVEIFRVGDEIKFNNQSYSYYMFVIN